MAPTNETVGELVSGLAVALGEQAELQVELVKAELARDAKALGRDVAPIVVGLPLLALGYLFGCVAAGLALARWTGVPAGLALVGLTNLVFGVVTTWRGLSTWAARSATTTVATGGYRADG